MLIMWEPLIMQELLISIMQEPKSGRSWTSKVFNTVITLDTYQFFYVVFDVGSSAFYHLKAQHSAASTTSQVRDYRTRATITRS